MTAIIVLALVALFVGLRLYSVLGERTGHEQPILKPAEQDKADAMVEPVLAPNGQSAPNQLDGDNMAYLPMAGPAVRQILAMDPTFNVARFLEGSKSAYRFILEAFWRGDAETLRPYVDGDVYATFKGAIEQREKDGLTLDNRLVAIDQAVIAAADLKGSVAEIDVRLEADIAAVTRNASGDVVAGSLSDAVQTRDRWTFRRDLASNDPNWVLIETDEE